ncbi:MAG: uroporphyrinogen decarboxylase [Proteobacteria bacterium]|nr:uroporphyrinogen decarboxylase [Pseudomonadota bacterium]
MSEFLRACRCEATRWTPIWLMRQAGRYQQEYRELRARVGFLELCKTPELAAEVTLLPVKQFELDAAIVFADILLVLEPLGIGFEFTDSEGPQLRRPLRDTRRIAELHLPEDLEDRLAYVGETIRLTCRELPRALPLIGFAGAPFTLASYVVEGGGSRHYMHTKKLMYSDPGAWHALMARLTEAVARYLKLQVAAGASALQVFDSWVGCLSPADYVSHVKPHMQALFSQLDPGVPVIHFGTGNPALYPLMKEAGGDVIGIDWRVDLGVQWKALGETAIMGNLDPGRLLGHREQLLAATRKVLASAAQRPGHIFNLGHGILPQTPVDQVKALVDSVHEESAR